MLSSNVVERRKAVTVKELIELLQTFQPEFEVETFQIEVVVVYYFDLDETKVYVTTKYRGNVPQDIVVISSPVVGDDSDY